LELGRRTLHCTGLDWIGGIELMIQTLEDCGKKRKRVSRPKVRTGCRTCKYVFGSWSIYGVSGRGDMLDDLTDAILTGNDV
jgi:hypothetical protein